MKRRPFTPAEQREIDRAHKRVERALARMDEISRRAGHGYTEEQREIDARAHQRSLPEFKAMRAALDASHAKVTLERQRELAKVRRPARPKRRRKA